MTDRRNPSAKIKKRTLAQALHEVLSQRIVVIDSEGRRKRVTKRKAIAMRLIQSGLSGDPISGRLLLVTDAAPAAESERKPPIAIIHPQEDDPGWPKTPDTT